MPNYPKFPWGQTQHKQESSGCIFTLWTGSTWRSLAAVRGKCLHLCFGRKSRLQKTWCCCDSVKRMQMALRTNTTPAGGPQGCGFSFWTSRAWRILVPKRDKWLHLFFCKKTAFKKDTGLVSRIKEHKIPWEKTQHQQQATGWWLLSWHQAPQSAACSQSEATTQWPAAGVVFVLRAICVPSALSLCHCLFWNLLFLSKMSLDIWPSLAPDSRKCCQFTVCSGNPMASCGCCVCSQRCLFL